MKKIICIALLILVLPFSAFSLAGCKKEKKISEFYNTYVSIADKYAHLKSVEISDEYKIFSDSTKVDIDYSSTPMLENRVNTQGTKYHYLESFYGELLNDSLSPLHFYGPKLIKKKISKSNTKLLYEKLHDLDQGFKDISYYQGILESSLQGSNDDRINYSHLLSLFEKYENTIHQATTLSMVVSSVYFNEVVDNGNPSFSEIDPLNISDTDILSIKSAVLTRLHYYKALYTDVYYEVYIRGLDIPKAIIDSAQFTPAIYSPQSLISGIDTFVPASISVLRESKQTLYNCAITLYKIQSQLDDRYDRFNSAKEKVTYSKVTQHSQIDERNYAGIIKQFSHGIVWDSHEVISLLTNIIYPKIN